MKMLKVILCLLILSSCSNKNTSLSEENTPSSNTSLSSEEISENTSFSIEELYINKENNSKIYGKLYSPINDTNIKKPLVILSHSAFLTGDSLKKYAIHFTSLNYYAFTFDFCGGSSSSKSDGNTKDMTIFTEVNDLKTVINYFVNKDFVLSDKIYLLGSSQGGLVSALTANEMVNYINGLILFYPAFNIPDQVNNMSSDLIFNQFIPMGEEYINSLKYYDPYKHIDLFTKKVLILHGDKDNTVPISYSIKASGIYKNCILKTIAGASHGFNKDNYSFFKDYDEEVLKYVDMLLND